MANAPRKPQDHKPKASTISDRFSFEWDGKTYTFKPTKEHINRGFYRRTRNESDVDRLFSMVEILAEDDETLEAFDNIPDEQFEEVFGDPFNAHLEAIEGASPGESQASST